MPRPQFRVIFLQHSDTEFLTLEMGGDMPESLWLVAFNIVALPLVFFTGYFVPGWTAAAFSSGKYGKGLFLMNVYVLIIGGLLLHPILSFLRVNP